MNRTLRKDVRANHVQLPESRRSDSESDWELVHKSRRSERKEKARVRDYKDTEESSSGSSDDSARLRRRKRDSRCVDKEKRKTRGRDRLAETSSESEPELDARGARRPRVEEDGIRAGKTLRSWNLKFSGRATKKAAEEFLHQLDDCREGNQLSDEGMVRCRAFLRVRLRRGIG